jgi:hypothetical protein
VSQRSLVMKIILWLLHIVSCIDFKFKSKKSTCLTLKFWSKVKYEHIFEFLGYDFLYAINTNSWSNTKSKEDIELWNVHKFSESESEKNRSQEIAMKNLRKDHLQIVKLLFVHLWHLQFLWRRIKFIQI